MAKTEEFFTNNLYSYNVERKLRQSIHKNHILTRKISSTISRRECHYEAIRTAHSQKTKIWQRDTSSGIRHAS